MKNPQLIPVQPSEGDNRATNAGWEVVGKDSQQTVFVNQTTNGSQWIRIASQHPFDQGTSALVRVSNQASPIPSVVVADAVSFVFVEALGASGQ